MSILGRTSRVLHENYGADGTVRSRMDVVDNTKVPLTGPDEILIPKHFVVLGGLALTAITVIFIAAFSVVVAAPRPGFFNETCASRSCLKGLNLKCINKTCLCATDEYYTNKCITKKNYMEKCGGFTSNCKNNTNMVCRDGVCKCIDTNYWNGKTCVAKNTYNQYCSSDSQCLTDSMLYCDLTRGKCSCDSKRFWDGTACSLRRTYNEGCKDSSQCDSTQHLICLNGKCNCNSTEFWDSILLTCYTKRNLNESCVASYVCYSPMNCTNNVCTCGSYQYYDLSAKQCKLQTTINTFCLSSFNCRVDKGLDCINNICQCSNSNYTWSSARDTCILQKTYTEQGCVYDTDCKVQKNLICNTGQQCNCPTTSITGMCDCIRNTSLEYYWDGSSCQQASSYGASCINSTAQYSCRWLKEGTVCTGVPGNYSCQCPSLMYFDTSNGRCKNQTDYNSHCQYTYSCRQDLGLSCQSHNCLCDSTTQFWSTTNNRCTNYYQYSNATCTANYQCASTLICNNNTNIKCNCPLLLSSGTCDCLKTNGNETFWNNLQCTSALSHGSNCSTTYMCKSLTEGTICNGTSGNLTCQCPYLMYFDPSTSVCKSQTSYNTNCTTYLACRSDLGLSCQSGKCLCDSTSQFWNSIIGKCIDYYKYSNNSCTADNQCASTLICNNSTNTKCNCPLSLSSGTCDCLKTYGNENYWNDVQCTSALAHGSNCSSTYMCKSLTEGTICNGTSGNLTCQCPYLMYFDPSTSGCKSQTSYNTNCTTYLACRSDLGLSCQSGKCLCNSTLQFWSSTNNICTDYYKYSNNTCTENSQCASTLICNNSTNTRCNCPLTLSSGTCDCLRENGNEYYWNNKECTSALAHGSNCSATYMCKSLTEGTICNGTSGNLTCQCAYLMYFDPSTSVCKSQTSYNTNCTTYLACRSDLGLSCQSGKCLCNSTLQFWSTTNNICTDYYKYSNNTCTDDYQCASSLICNNSTNTKCNCPLSLSSGTCDCLREIGTEYFWNSNECTLALGHGSNCSSTYTCKSLTEGTICNGTTSNYTCQCPYLMYFDPSTSVCKNQTSYNSSCSTYLACRSDLGLSCQSSLCLCNSTFQFWDTATSQCIDYYKYSNNTCTADYQCASTLICNNSTNTKCSCPLTLPSGSCDCLREIGTEYFWNNNECTLAFTHGSNCSSTYMCKSLTEGTICNGTSGNSTCQCPYLMYFDPSTSVCKSQTSYNTNCTTYLACRSDLGLSCQSSKCLCNSTLQFWSTTNNICTDYYKYSNNTCTDDYQCASTLICNNSTNTKCNCPLSLSSGTCDCLRENGNEYYWNDLQCSTALAHGSNCSSTYMCKSLTEGTICNGTSGNLTCQCPYLMYFDPSTSVCKSQTSYNTNCTTYLACRSDLGLSCQSGQCLCNSIVQFWSSSVAKCINYYQYGESGCTSNSQCASTLICNNSTNTKCNCPLSLPANTCDCYREVGNEKYWNGSACVSAVSYNETCANGTTSYMCQTLTQKTSCDNTTKRCTCGSSGGLSTVSNQCMYCSSGWNFFNGKCYRFTTLTFPSTSDLSTFNNSNIHTACSNVSATLAVINDLQTFNYINSMISTGQYWVGAKFNTTTCTAGALSPTSFASEDGSWVLGNNSANTMWCGTPVPKSGSVCSHCMYYNRASSCFWNDACTNSKMVICQIP